MIRASMLELVRSGKFGPLRHGMTREELRQLLGAPPLWGTQKTEDHAVFWRYGDIEYYFDERAVSFLFSDHENLTGGGSTLEIDPWIVRLGLPRIEFERSLALHSVNFTVARWQYDASQQHVTTDPAWCFRSWRTTKTSVIKQAWCGGQRESRRDKR